MRIKRIPKREIISSERVVPAEVAKYIVTETFTGKKRAKGILVITVSVHQRTSAYSVLELDGQFGYVVFLRNCGQSMWNIIKERCIVENILVNRQIAFEINAVVQNVDEGEGFKKILKIGIYKELHKKGLLSDFQLDALLNMQERA